MGSPHPAAQQILLRATVTCLFIHSLPFRFSSSLTGSSLCSTHREGCIPHVFFCRFFSLCLYPHPPSLAVSSLSIPFPQLFSCSVPPSPSLPPSVSSGYMQQGANSSGERERQQRRLWGFETERERGFRSEKGEQSKSERQTERGTERRRRTGREARGGSERKREERGRG